MRVRYTPRAFADREAIFVYLNEHNPRTAREVKAFIKARINELGSFPEKNPFVKELGVRVSWLGRYPYLIYYRVKDQEIAIIHIRHAAREPWKGGA